MENTSSASTKFGLDLFRVICDGQPDANGFISPFSMSVALSMTQLGANGETAHGMVKALRWEDRDEVIIHQENLKYIILLQMPNQEYILSTANRLYIDQGFSVMPEFLEKTHKFYLADAASSQFKSNPENERVSINTWVSEQTQDKINDLIGPGSINSDTKMVLVNAIYFKGNWSSPFDPSDTMRKPFKVSKRTNKNVSTMTAQGMYKCWMDDGTEGFSALEIPYKGDQLSMIILLPTDDFGLADLEKRLTSEEMTSIFGRLQQEQEVKLFLPKFEMTCSYQMKEPLCQLGMSAAFDALHADFSRITGNKELFVSDVIHKAFVKVNEEGSEAAAATAVMMSLNCIMVEPVRPPEFIVDHPFLFVIRDKRASDTILFMGRVMDPTK